ncbi:MAG TPA: hypothetical protein VGH54_21620 [Mycobacterium sp.]|jgi:hypothetical protein|uniref:hypothetical protein n=1 Tax=Mycobacterium sp. TaxID=1785 RepID=UPI002F3F174D
MAFDVGDPIPLVFNTTDATGAPANVGAAVLTITLPDGTLVVPPVGNIGVGIYQPVTPYLSTQGGRHKVTWVATGVNAQDYTDTFYVLAADPGLLISVDEARKALGKLPGADTAHDEDLRSLIASALAPMEDLAGSIVQRPYDEWHDGGSTLVCLLHGPAFSVTSVTECYGAGYSRPLTQQVLDGGAFDAFGYTVDLDDAILIRRIAGQAANFVGGHRNIHVVYTAGRTVIGPNIIRATRRLVRWLWQTEIQGSRPPNQGPDSAITTPSGYQIPKAILQLLGPDLRPPAVG